MRSSDRKGKGVRRGANAFANRLGAFGTQGLYFGGLRFVRDYLWRRFAHFNPGAHFLDLCGLLLELDRESLYLFLLLRDRCLQLLNFVIEHGLVLGARGR